MVKLARHVFTGEKVAVKVIDKTKLDEVARSHLFQEVRCMKLVQHPNVVRLYEVIDTQTKLYLILELGDGGDLYDYIMRHENGLDQEHARHYFRQVGHDKLLSRDKRAERIRVQYDSPKEVHFNVTFSRLKQSSNGRESFPSSPMGSQQQRLFV